MKKKQLFAGALAAAMMTASLAGCGGAASSAATSTTDGDTASSTASADTNSGVVEVTIPSFKTGENVGAVFFLSRRSSVLTRSTPGSTKSIWRAYPRIVFSMTA